MNASNEAHSEYFSRLRGAEIGIHHHIAGALCSAPRRSRRGAKITAVSNGDQVTRVAALAMKRGKSVDFTGYWQRHAAN